MATPSVLSFHDAWIAEVCQSQRRARIEVVYARLVLLNSQRRDRGCQYVPDMAISNMGLSNWMPMTKRPGLSPSSVLCSRAAHQATIPFTSTLRLGSTYWTATGKSVFKLVSR